MGFETFPASLAPPTPLREPSPPGLPSPVSRFTPSEGFPSPIAVSRHRDLCPLAVQARFGFSVPRCCHQLPNDRRVPADLKALLHLRVRCPLDTLPCLEHSILPWASFPSKALPSTALPVWALLGAAPKSHSMSRGHLPHFRRSTACARCTARLASPKKRLPLGTAQAGLPWAFAPTSPASRHDFRKSPSMKTFCVHRPPKSAPNVELRWCRAALRRPARRRGGVVLVLVPRHVCDVLGRLPEECSREVFPKERFAFAVDIPLQACPTSPKLCWIPADDLVSLPSAPRASRVHRPKTLLPFCNTPHPVAAPVDTEMPSRPTMRRPVRALRLELGFAPCDRPSAPKRDESRSP